MKYKAKPINILQDLQVLKMIVIMLMILILKELYLKMIKNLDESLEKIYKQLNVFIKNFVILLQENIFIQKTNMKNNIKILNKKISFFASFYEVHVIL